jgi:maltooligosyltrehalose trehalohydrolase
MKPLHAMPFGARLLDRGGARFGLWAPGAQRVDLQLEKTAARIPMSRDESGWHSLTLPEAAPGLRYRYVVDGRPAVPDPASRFNPDDVHGPSELTDPHAYRWSDAQWRGRPWHEAVVYELHVGSFTPQGSYAAAMERLPELAALGITAIELLPLAAFPGERSWGYDGVLLFAPDASYGHPDELKAFVDRAHGLGLMVLLDVVYNHFGPEGNYLHGFCPEFFNAAHQTPWGSAINFDGDHSGPVRDFYVHNALYWVEEFHFDGLRLDAVHALRDDSSEHIVDTIAHALHDGPGRERSLHLVLENEHNEAHRLARDDKGVPRGATAQWNDDFHHAAHVLLTGEADAYYADYADDPLRHFARALAEGFAWQGEVSPYRDGRPHGEPSTGLPQTAFVSFVQNHDQIGNRAFGERLHMLAADAQRLDAVYACLLLSPHIPMLFCGEEFAASSPFPFFCDFGPELAEAVSKGRRAEFARFPAFADERARERIPDPNARATFEMSKLKWDERKTGAHAQRLSHIRHLLALRKQLLVPRMVRAPTAGRWSTSGGLIRVDWTLRDGARWSLAANFGNTACLGEEQAGSEVYASVPLRSHHDALLFAPASVRVTLQVPDDA